jgi:hypothetical protein
LKIPVPAGWTSPIDPVGGWFGADDGLGEGEGEAVATGPPAGVVGVDGVLELQPARRTRVDANND